MRANRELYKGWKLPILQRDGFSCTRCRGGKPLVVHHDQEGFADILKKVISSLFPGAQERELTFEEATKIIDAVVAYHIEHSVSGRTLCRACHKREHAAT